MIRQLELFPANILAFEIVFQELKPTLDELGIPTPAEMGYDKPELWMPNPYEG